MKNIINRLAFVALSVFGLLFMAAVFVIGMVAFWYILLLGVILITVRRVQIFFKTRHRPRANHTPHQQSHTPHKGRVIEHEDKDDGYSG